jgi:ABC-type sugar transport system substrate-binding protein
MINFRSLSHTALAAAFAALMLAAPAQAQDKKPIVIGGTLGLTGMFADPAAD